MLRVPNSTQQEMPMDNMPPMDFAPQGDMGMPQPMGDMPMDNMMTPGMEAPNQFDTNFDAGVEANEEEDPKKFIQQLTGKLSQSLRKYTENNGQPDAELNKYVAGMIIKQSIEGLSSEDVDDILDKVKSEDGGEPMQDMQSGEEQMMGDGGMEQQPEAMQPNESVLRDNDYDLDEIVNSVLDREEKEPYQKTTGKKSFRKSPFTSPNFEN